ncbi:MAG: hypothetical protein WD069_13880 [Planctomycetales bacterium]
MTDPRFAGMREALARLVPHVPATKGMSELDLKQATKKPGALPGNSEALVAMGPLVYRGALICLTSDEAPPSSVQLYYEIMAVLGQDPDGAGRAAAVAFLVERFLESKGKVDDDRRPRPATVRKAFTGLWEFLSSPDTDAKKTASVLDSQDFREILTGFGHKYVTFRALTAPGDDAPAVRKEIDAAIEEVRSAVSAAARKLPARERQDHLAELTKALQEFEDRSNRDQLAHSVIIYRAWERLVSEFVRAVNADDKPGYLKLHSADRRAEIERLIANSPAEPLKQVLFGYEGITVKSVAIRSRSFDWGAVFEVTTDSGSERVDGRNDWMSLRKTPDGWVFGRLIVQPDPDVE